MKTVEITDANFEQVVLHSNKPVLVDFSAEWCGPCKVMTPVISMLADELSDAVTVGKIDVDTSPITTAKFGVRNMPTFLLFKDGNVIDRVVGAVPKSVLENKILSATAV